MTETPVEGTFLVTAVDEGTAVVRNVADDRVHTLGEAPDWETGEVIVGRLAPADPTALTWELVETEERWTVTVERSPEAPTRQARSAAAEQDVGELTTLARAGEGEVHVLTVDADRTEAAAAEVAQDEATRERAARLGVSRVEIRAAEGVLSVRYLP